MSDGRFDDDLNWTRKGKLTVVLLAFLLSTFLDVWWPPTFHFTLLLFSLGLLVENLRTLSTHAKRNVWLDGKQWLIELCFFFFFFHGTVNAKKKNCLNRNPRIPCNELPTIDLRAWREPGPAPGTTCNIAGSIIQIGQSHLPSPCVQCTCTTEGVSLINCWEPRARCERVRDVIEYYLNFHSVASLQGASANVSHEWLTMKWTIVLWWNYCLEITLKWEIFGYLDHKARYFLKSYRPTIYW